MKKHPHKAMLHVLVEVEFDPAETNAETAMDTALVSLDNGLRAHNLTYVARYADLKADLGELVYQAPDPRIRNN